MSELNTSAGGIHPGKPIIWPNVKPTPTSSQTQQSTEQQTQQTQAQQTQTSQTQTSSSQSSTAVATPASTPATPSPAATATAVPQAASRALTVNDIKMQLSMMQIPETEANIKLASLMIRYGQPLDSANFMKALGMLSGTNNSSSTQEAAMLLLSKGITGSQEAVQMLSNQLSENPSVAQQLTSAKASMAQVSSSLLMNPAMFSPQMMSQLTALISQFNAMIDDLPKKYKFGSDQSGAIGREDLLNDVRGLKSLFDGIQEKALSKENKATPENEAMRSDLISASKKMGDLLENITSQILLSQKASSDSLGKENYLYYQIPNAMTTPPTSTDIIIKQNKSGDNNIDMDDTHVAIGLETEGLGKIMVSLIVRDKEVKVMFNTELEGTKKLCEQENNSFKTALTQKGYKVTECQSRVNKSMCSIKSFLIPILGLGNLFRINSTV